MEKSQEFPKNKCQSGKITVPGLGSPGGAVVKNPPANAGDTGLSPGLGRSHMPWSNWARAPQLLSLRATTTEPVRLEPVLHNEKPLQWEGCAPQRRVAPARHNQRKARAQQQRPNTAKTKINKKKIKIKKIK